jgi:hypothetical protein
MTNIIYTTKALYQNIIKTYSAPPALQKESRTLAGSHPPSNIACKAPFSSCPAQAFVLKIVKRQENATEGSGSLLFTISS